MRSSSKAPRQQPGWSRPDTRRGYVVLKSVATIIAWSFGLAAAYAVWATTRSESRPHGDCGVLGCLSDQDGAYITGILFGIPLLATCSAVAIVIAAVIAPRIRSGVVTGTLAIMCSIALVAAAGALWLSSAMF